VNGWVILVAGIVIGVAVVPVARTALYTLAWLTARTVTPRGCRVCDHAPKWNSGDRSNAAYLLGKLRHDLYVRSHRWHRDAWAVHRWNPQLVRSGSESWHRVDCAEHEFPDVTGPYADPAVAARVAREHELAQHAGAPLASVADPVRM
jgi:hypothetical protein